MDTLLSFWNFILHFVSQLRWQDLLDIVIVSFVIYKVFSFIKGTRAVSLIQGLLLLVLTYYIAKSFLELKILTSVLENAATLIIVAIPVIFQPELRKALSELGRGMTLFRSGNERLLGGQELLDFVDVLLETLKELSEHKTGALVVIERRIGLNDYIQSGVKVDAVASKRLIRTIFQDKTPLHDGAIVLRGERLMAASVFLPLTEATRSPAGLYWGTRHQAAIGISEVSDAASIVVSEETGQISIILDGKVHRNLSGEVLKNKLLDVYQLNQPRRAETGLLKNIALHIPEESPERAKRFKKYRRRLGRIFNLRFISLVIAIVWGLAVGLGTAPKPRIDLENRSRQLLLPIEIKGSNNELLTKVEPAQITLEISGKSDVLDTLNLKEIEVLVELENTELSEQILPVVVALPSGVKINKIAPRFVSVNLLKMDEQIEDEQP